MWYFLTSGICKTELAGPPFWKRGNQHGAWDGSLGPIFLTGAITSYFDLHTCIS